MIYSARNLGIEIDTGSNAPGAALQRLAAGEWIDHLIDAKLKRLYADSMLDNQALRSRLRKLAECDNR